MTVSMTGYGRAWMDQDGGRILVEIKSVNHRFREIQFRMPRQLAFLEDRLRRLIAAAVERGKLDVFITMEGTVPVSKEAQLDWDLVHQFLDHADDLEKLNVFDSRLNLESFLFHPEIMTVEESSELNESWVHAAESTVSEAVRRLTVMRRSEGEKLHEDLEKRLENITSLTTALQKQAPAVVEEYRSRLKEKIHALLHGHGEVDEQRMITETAIFADKIDTAEEITRLFSHCSQFSQILTQQGSKGRKLDFLVQEMNREMNTIGSKANNASMSHLVVELKSELEKIKEQVQNIE
ncbi:YicC/YloC family endoribonuclease [Bacillus piscicola]|uniref:YicC/YloC family endoribonuclease n=1 Tax=Bacillus piscicola TaxID=1632684 RepID=UPI001F09D90C|nr:YicC/YloC family endoribonuclease [Bacillus piscicola]